MSDADRLEQEFRSGRLLRPSADILNLVDLANATAAVVGSGTRPLTSGAEKIAGLIGPADHLVLVAADGLGMALVDSLDADGFLRRHVTASLRTTFPSTTATAFTSLATGQWPNRHAALGWFTYIPDIDAVSTIIPFVRSADGAPLTDLGTDHRPGLADTIPRRCRRQAAPVAPALGVCGRHLLRVRQRRKAPDRLRFSRGSGGLHRIAPC